MLTSETITRIRECVTADYACPDAPGFSDSLAARRDVAALLKDRAELQAEIERLRTVAEAAHKLLADPEWCQCMTINPNCRHPLDRPNKDYPATCEICGAFECSGCELLAALAALEADTCES